MCVAPLSARGKTRCSVAGAVRVTGSDSADEEETSALREAEGVGVDVLRDELNRAAGA